jgi:hypothetical protein
LFVSTVITRRKAEKDARKAKPKSLSLTPSPAKKGRQAAGWRGLSVDLITNPDDHPILSLQEEDDNEDDDAKEDHVGLEERLGGRIVKLIWNASKLDRQKLGDIWYAPQYFDSPKTYSFFTIGRIVIHLRLAPWTVRHSSKGCGGLTKNSGELNSVDGRLHWALLHRSAFPTARRMPAIQNWYCNNKTPFHTCETM